MEFVIQFERRPDQPLYRCLSDAFKRAIVEGRLLPGQKIPSVRVLSELTEVSRNTAHLCYQTLESEGYIQAVQGKGVFVRQPMTAAPAVPAPGDTQDMSPQVVRPVTSMTETLLELQPGILAHRRAAVALQHQMPSLEDLPLQQLKRALLKHSRFADPSLLSYTGDPFGHPVLRDAIASYLRRARAIKCSADQVVVSSRPSQELLDMVCRLFVNAGDYVAVEHPGYSQPRQIFQLHGAEIVPVPVDDGGLCVRSLAAEKRPIKIVYTTPSHHDPTGAILSLERRKQLLAFAKRNHTLIWEDDVENEYRYGSEPIPALFALDTEGSVIYQSTFWRTLCPVVRLGFAVLPADKTRDLVYCAKYMLDRDLPIVEQLALAELINDGSFERHVRTMRKKFTSRRQTAVHHLSMKLPGLVSLYRNTAGLHLRALFDASVPSEPILRCARESGLPLSSTGAYYMHDAPPNEYLIQFAHTSEAQLEKQIGRFAELIKSEACRAQVSLNPVVIKPPTSPLRSS